MKTNRKGLGEKTWTIEVWRHGKLEASKDFNKSTAADRIYRSYETDRRKTDAGNYIKLRKKWTQTDIYGVEKEFERTLKEKKAWLNNEWKKKGY